MNLQQKETRRERLNWILENIEVAKIDPFNSTDVQKVVYQLQSVFKIKNRDAAMAHQSTHTLLVQARKLKGLK